MDELATTTIQRYQIYREVNKRDVPIWFYALEGREDHTGWNIVRCVMDTKGRITPWLYRPLCEWRRPDAVIYFPNYFQAWAYRLRLEQQGVAFDDYY